MYYEALRSEGYDACIIVLTACTLAGDRRKCLEVGCDGYTANPIDRTAPPATGTVWLTLGQAHHEWLRSSTAPADEL
jgi:CheY-like chemotaxis protein